MSCGAAFARKHDLQRHMRTLHSPNRPFQCPYPKCAHAFRRANSFWRHLVEEHPDTSSEHAEIYQAAVHAYQSSQKQGNEVDSPVQSAVLTNGATMVGKDVLLTQNTTSPIEIPMRVKEMETGNEVFDMSGLNDGYMYRGHFSV